MIVTPRRALSVVLGTAAVLTVAAVSPAGVARAATAPDPSKITATCFAADNPNGPFSASNDVVVWAGSPLSLKLGYHNDDKAADPAYFAGFTARIAGTTAFGPAHTIDTSSQFGGVGNGQGTVKGVALPTSTPVAAEEVVITITSNSAPGILATCDFKLTVQALNDDLDGDGLSNDIEMNGLRDGNGNLTMTAAGEPAGDFPTLGANPCRKDLFIQLEYQIGPGHDHLPKTAALDQVRQAFADAPLSRVAGGCPFSGFSAGGGIHLGIDIGDPLPAETVTTNQDGSSSVTPVNCATIPLARFDPLRRPYFLYSVWVHQSAADSQSGLGPCGARSFIVSLGLWPGNGTALQQAGTFMHELGHVLGLGHGGNDPVNLKPNYLSVMNYAFQPTGVLDAGGTGHADYSRAALPTLDEAALAEGAGAQGPAGLQTRWWGPQPAFRYPAHSSPFRPADSSLDWNQNGSIDSGTVSVDVNSDGMCTGPGPNALRDTAPAADDVVSGNEVWDGANRVCDSRPAGDDTLAPQANVSWCVLPGANATINSTRSGDDTLNDGIITLGPNVVCDTTAAGDDVQFVPVGRTESRLFGFDDWAAVDWRIGPQRTQPGPTAPLPPVAPHHDLTEEQATAITAATNPSTHPDLEVRASVDTADALPGDTLTYTATVANTGTGDATNVQLVETLPGGGQIARPLPGLAPGASVTETFTYTVPVPVADHAPQTATATASGQSSAGTPEEQTNNNTASATATAHSARCPASGAGAIGTARTFVFAAGPLATVVAGSTSYLDLTPGAPRALMSVNTTAIACFQRHARIFGTGLVNGTTPVTFRIDASDNVGTPGTDRFSISWPGYTASGQLTKGDVKVGH